MNGEENRKQETGNRIQESVLHDEHYLRDSSDPV
jgi:hypothetical protein